MLFNEKGNTLERFVNEVSGEDRNAVSRFIHDLISWLKARLKGEKVSLKIVKLENRFAAVLRNVDNTNAQKNNTTNDGDVQYEIKYPQFESSDFDKNIVLLSKMPIVKKLSGNEFAKTEKPLSERVMDYFNSLNNSVYSDLFGDVSLTNSSMRDDIYGHGRTTQKIIAFAAILEVIQQGVVIDSQKRGNGNYDRIIVAAPITIGTDKYLMGVMLQRDHQSQRLYLHDVVAINEKETMSSPSTTPFTSEVEGNNDSLYMTTILKKALNVKENDNGVSYSFEITPEQDTAYLDAVNNGDTEAAQRIVDEAAERAGYTVKAYHGTPNGNFTKFDTNKIASTTDAGIFGRGFYFTTHKETADVYATENGKTMPVYLQSNNPWWAVAHRNIQEVSEKLGMEESALTLRGYGGKGRIVTPTMSQSGQFSAHLQEHGYDSVIVQHGKNNYEIVVFDSNAIKSADAITYDDNGDVIPLSQRFNDVNNDIRYSFEDDVVDKTSSLAERVRLGEMSQTEYLNELQRLMNEANEKYGAIPKGENPKVDVTVPKEVSDKRNTRRFVRTVLESGTLT